MSSRRPSRWTRGDSPRRSASAGAASARADRRRHDEVRLRHRRREDREGRQQQRLILDGTSRPTWPITSPSSGSERAPRRSRRGQVVEGREIDPIRDHTDLLRSDALLRGCSPDGLGDRHDRCRRAGQASLRQPQGSLVRPRVGVFGIQRGHARQPCARAGVEDAAEVVGHHQVGPQGGQPGASRAGRVTSRRVGTTRGARRPRRTARGGRGSSDKLSTTPVRAGRLPAPDRKPPARARPSPGTGSLHHQPSPVVPIVNQTSSPAAQRTTLPAGWDTSSHIDPARGAISANSTPAMAGQGVAR